jgi:putative ABC transport system permease protein
VSHAEAGAAVDGLLTALAAKSPRVYAGARGRVVPIRDELTGDVRLALWMLMASAGVLLAVACVNAANLLLVRNMARSRETAVRVALGASRVQLLQQSFAEAVIVVAAAGAAGLAAAQLLVRTLLSLGRSGVPRLDAESVRLDRPVFLFALGIVAIAAGVMTFLPAFRSEQPMVTLKGTVPAGSAGPKQRRLQNALVVIQLAASVVLLVGAGLLGRSLIELMTADVGVQTDHVATVAVNLSYQRKLADAQQVAEIQALVARIRSLPNVTAVGAGASLPPKASTIRLTLKRSGDTVDYQATAVPATPGYFHALGIRLLDGRLFSDGDTDGARQVMIMTADTARRFFGSSHPIGRTMTLPVLRNGVPGTASVTLVGVVSDIKYSGLDAPPDDAVFRPLAQQPWPLLFVVARTTGDPSLVVSALPHEIAAVDPGIAVSSSGTLDEIVAAEAAQPRFRTVLLAATSLLTLSIAALGLYGAMAHAVSQRTREFGVRMALGATGTDLIAGVVLDGARLAGAGLALGLIGSVAAARAMVGLLYETKPADALSVGVASGVLLVVALVATYLPARKAAHLDPSAAFRAE